MNMPSPTVLLLGVLACLLLAFALWLLARAQHQQRTQSVSTHLQRSLQGGSAAASAGVPASTMPDFGKGAIAATTPQGRLDAWLDQHLGIRAWGISPRLLQALAGLGLLLAVAAGMMAGFAGGLLLLAIYGLLLAFFIWRRTTGRRKRLLEQLPGFLDNMVRLIAIGNSPHAAFQIACANVPAPLGEALQQATAALSASPDLGNAMAQLERNWRLPEFGLLAAVFRMSVRYGGRADLVLERVSAYIRDRQSAERELHALSAEVRLSAWILSLLPIVVGGLIMALNPGYFMRMWSDASGQKMIFAAAGLQAFGALLLYRLAQLK